MGQRINIQYSIDIDDLPDEVSRLLQNATQELDKLSNSNITDPLSLSGLESISELRKGLANVDAVLQDVSAIVNGYLSYKVAPSQPQQSEEIKHEVTPQVEYSF
jgi:Mg2+ and Co2+ transporter CorA